MDPDLALVIGLVLAVLSVPSIISAFSNNRTPRVATIALMAGGGLIVYAINASPSGYTLQEIPEAIFRVLSRVL
ncbi:hypothetical protein [Cognatishimia sp. F0-27]|uniref:hypothetical protein n=1 Tax=Cognatishimia sp. F0-27 TaxID=2816855 RepID=UPI001D0C9B64|nr:hypothetical protein [Cognatishimia sp. F0-27]MCC1491437.1 hypothetical protein [Cognatishimia sp. F0-27]